MSEQEGEVKKHHHHHHHHHHRHHDDNQEAKQEADPPMGDDQDPITYCIGNYGKWQLKMTFLLALCSFPCTFHIFAPTFLAAPKDYWCARPNHLNMVDTELWKNISLQDKCTMASMNWSMVTVQNIEKIEISNGTRVPCTEWEWDDSEIGQTINQEWNLICDRDYLNTLADVLFLFGIGLGGVVSGLISDRFGRKKTLTMALIFQSIVAVSLCFCPWFELYLLLRVLLGFVSVAVVFSAFVIIVELVGGSWRTTCGVCNFFPLPVSYIVVALLSMALPNWRNLQMVISIPGILLITLWWIAPESPNWLLIMGRVDEVKKILKEASEFNNKPLPDSIDKILQPENSNNADNTEASGVADLFRGPMKKITLCVFVMWFATTWVYYGLVLNISAVGGNLHITSIIMGFVELPAIAISIPILQKLGRRYPIALSMIIAGAFCIIAGIGQLITDKNWAKILFIMVSKFFISSTNGVLPMFTAELYPTLMRNLGVGASQVAAGIGLVFIPYVWNLESVSPSLPFIVTGITGIVGGLTVLLLPETLNRSLAAPKQ